MIELKFNSQVCTTVEQSKKLLELGLKPETADMYYSEGSMDAEGDIEYHLRIRREWEDLLRSNDIPAWSLHRLFDIMYVHCHELKACENVYDAMIKRIEKTIEHNTHNEYYFNKEYLNK